ncbi:hypothetical protein PoB_002881200 [Plakobranchus ocellatus]|uniref:Uncharacterized protein n=1 Tax=Plakobranchus ocellatus TaxID=259542 RepID=A0AAV4A626_9GAST|nr:hypothetical protein PoB_002881200 [Plakobranchus ocellatus]
MNKHTLNYHTRLHDWYRQHSIKLQKQELLQQLQQQQLHHRQQQQQQTTDPAGTGEVPARDGGNLTQDKLHAIHDWCADVNRNLFRVKKREAPPLFRRCRVTSASTVASGNSSSAAWGRRQARGGVAGSTSAHFRAGDPRRVRSADVFTVTGHWAKQPKAMLSGGELLAKRPVTAPRNHFNAATQRVKQTSTEELDLCIRNSRDAGEALDAEGQMARTLPRVNHDSLHLRSNALVLKQNGPRLAERGLYSPRDSLSNTPDPSAGKLINRFLQHEASRNHCASCKPAQTEEGRRAKSANTGARLRFMDEAGDVSEALDSNQINEASMNHQRAVELAKNAKNSQYSRQRPATSKAGGRPDTGVADSTQTGNAVTAEPSKVSTAPSAITRGEDQQEEEEQARSPSDTLLHVRPGFCNKCSGIYSGPGKDDARDTSASPACGNCIHGISVDSTQQLQRQLKLKQQQQQQQSAHTRKQRVTAEERIDMELRKTEMEVSQVESRLSENGIHYSAERAGIREETRGLIRPGTTSTAALRARLAAQMAMDEEDGEDALDTADGLRGKSEYSDDESNDLSGSHDSLDHGLEQSPAKKTRKSAGHVTIITGGGHDGDDDSANNNKNGAVNGYVEDSNGERGRDGENDPRGHDQIPIRMHHKDDEYAADDCDNDGDDDDGSMEPPDPAQLTRVRGSHGGRRKSISFTYKPVIAAPSISNGLLNVLSIDDCKFHMRYSPHKILEEHEITENLMVPLSLLQFNEDDDEEEEGDDEDDDNGSEAGQPKQQQQRPQHHDTNSKVAMRISRSPSPELIYTGNERRAKGLSNKNLNNKGENRNGAASPNTSICSSTARKATAANVRKFRALHDPDDMYYHKSQRPRSACLARAFHTLIHDRTIMQRLDTPSKTNNNNNNTINNTNNNSNNNNNIRNVSVRVRTSAKSLKDGQKKSATLGGGGSHGPRGSEKWDARDTIDGVLKVEGGPKYRKINAALRRHMGELMQEQCKKLQVQYQRQRNAGQLRLGNKRGGGGVPSPSPSLSVSLSLESLPQTKKGILKPSTATDDSDDHVLQTLDNNGRATETESGDKGPSEVTESEHKDQTEVTESENKDQTEVTESEHKDQTEMTELDDKGQAL